MALNFMIKQREKVSKFSSVKLRVLISPPKFYFSVYERPSENTKSQNHKNFFSTSTFLEHIFGLGDVAAEAFLFFVGGFETAAVAISWAIYELAVNQELQKKARAEIHRVLDKYDGEITYAGVQELTYLDNVVYGELLEAIDICSVG